MKKLPCWRPPRAFSSAITRAAWGVIPALSLLAQDPPAAPDARAELARLLETTSRIESFVATYRITKPDDPGTVRFTYRAPDEALLEARSGKREATFWILGERMVWRMDDGSEAVHADVNLAEAFERSAAIEAVLRSEFPDRAHFSELDAGPVFNLEPHAKRESADDPFVDYQLSWEPHRKSVFGWLVSAAWNDAQVEEKRITRAPERGLTAALSRETGFVELIQDKRFPSKAELESLKVDVAIEDGVFRVTKPESGSRDITSEIQPKVTSGALQLARAQIYAVAQEVLERDGPEGLEVEARLAKAFEALHGPLQLTMLGNNLEKVDAGIESFLEQYGERWKQNKDDPVEREKLVEAAKEWRAGLEKQFSEPLGAYVDRLSAPKPRPGSESRVERALEVERKAARSVFQREIVDVRLERLAAGLRAITEGN